MSRILKSHTVTTEQRWLPLPVIEPISEAELEEDSRAALLQAAQEEAASLLAAARQQSELLRQQAYEEGIAQGAAAGEATYQEKLAYLEAQAHEINLERDHYLDQAEGELVRLAIGIAEKVICRQLTLDQELIVAMARAHLTRIRERETITIRVHPQELPVLERGRDALLHSVDGLHTVILEGDSRLGPGDLMFEAESGALDARVSTQLAVIERALAEAEDEETTDEPHLL